MALLAGVLGAGCTEPNPAFHPGDADWADTGSAADAARPPDVVALDQTGPAPEPPAQDAAAPDSTGQSDVAPDGTSVPPDLAGPADTSPDLSPDLPPDRSPDLPPDLPPDLTMPAAGLVLRWTFDEPGGTVANDISGRNIHGTYAGVNGTPSPSPMVPTVSFPNVASRAFVRGRGHGVTVTGMPAALKPANNLTVTAWYRAMSLDTSSGSIGSEIVNAGDNYVLRLKPSQVDFSKRTDTSTPFFSQCLGSAPSRYLDGGWHHLAGVSTTSGIRVYFDGVQICSNNQGESIRHTEGNNLWVGRHATLSATHNNFEGNIDDVRIYDRALSAAEILSLASGRP